MTNRDVATITLKALAAWWFANGVAGLISALLTWRHDAGEFGSDTSMMAAAASAIFIPVGAVAWLVSDWAAARVFPHATEVAAPLDRGALYGFASVLVGLFLLADAIPQTIYWVVVWRAARGTGFWNAAAEGPMDNTVVYWVAARAQVGAVVTKLVLGLGLLCGPERIKRALHRLRHELSDHLAEPTDANKPEPKERS